MTKPKVYTIAQAIKKLKTAKKYEYFHIKMRGMYDIEDDLEKLGYERDDTDSEYGNTNGWEVDFFYRFEHPTDGKIVISGAVWQSGEMYRISKADHE